MPLMFHPEFPGKKPTVTSINAFNNVWSGKGWMLVTEYETVGSLGDPITWLASLNLTELRAEAKARDIAGRTNMNRDELTQALIDVMAQG